MQLLASPLLRARVISPGLNRRYLPHCLAVVRAARAQTHFQTTSIHRSAFRQLVTVVSSSTGMSSPEPRLAPLEYWFSRSTRYEEVLVEGTEDVQGAAIPVQPVAQVGPVCG
jgi:hypothetical protein